MYLVYPTDSFTAVGNFNVESTICLENKLMMGKDLPHEYLSNLYDDIQNRPIQVDADHVASQQQVDITDPVVWATDAIAFTTF
eukprot:gene5284-5819_t